MVKNLVQAFLFMTLLITFQPVVAQINVSINNVEAAPGGQAVVDVSVDNLVDVTGMSFSIGYDSTVVRFNAIENIISQDQLPDIGPQYFGTPNNSQNDEGMISFTYYDEANGEHTLPNGSVLFSVRFDVVGPAGSVSSVDITNDPVTVEFFDADFNVLNVTTTSGSVTVQQGVDPNGIIITAGMVTVEPGAQACVPMTADNFTGEIVVGSGTILFDDDILDFTGIENIYSDMAAAGLNNPDFNAGTGEVRMTWVHSSNDPEPFNIPDGTALFDVCFTATGQPGDMSVIDLINTGNLPWKWYDNNGELPSSTVDGKVTIAEGEPTDVTFIIESKTVTMGSNACFDVSVRNYDDIVTSQFGIRYDGSVLDFTGAQSTGVIPEIDANAFSHNANNNEIGYILGLDQGRTVADDEAIFEICFDIIGDCDAQGLMEIGSFNGPTLEVSQGTIDNIVDVATVDGTATVVCMPECTLVRTDASCPEGTNGNIIVNIENGCDCVWVDSNGNEISSECNLLNVGPGDYSLTVTCPGQQPGCTLEATVDALPAIGITGVVTNAACGELGSIEVSTAGTGNYSYSWVPELSGGASVSDLTAGMYTVTVTDADSGCEESKTFEVTETSDLSIQNVTIVDSDGANGSITVVPGGGTEPYTYEWTGASGLPNSGTITGLAPGNYTVTITDANGCTVTSETLTVNSTNAGFVINDITIVKQSGNYGVLCFGDKTGVVTGNLSKGALPVTIKLVGPETFEVTLNNLGAFSIDEVGAGEYTLEGTDADGETISIPGINVLGPDRLLVKVVDGSYNCSDGTLCDGEVEIEIEGGIPAYDYEWSDNDITGTKAEDLCAGNYNVIVTDAHNCQSMLNITIQDCNSTDFCYQGTRIMTPNGDGINDVFSVTCIENSDASLRVFNRWGELVYQNLNYLNNWDGRDLDGKELLEGAYMWVVEADFGVETRLVKGTVTILRNQ